MVAGPFLYPPSSRWTSLTPAPQLDFNRGVIIRSFSYPKIDETMSSLGFKMTTAYSCLINYLLRPKPAVLAFIAQYTSFFALPENFVVGIQIRTGDLSMVRRALAPSRNVSLTLVSPHSGPTTKTPSTPSTSTNNTSPAPTRSRAPTLTRRKKSSTT